MTYYLSGTDTDPIIRLYIPEQLRKSIFLEYHESDGHMGIDKNCDTIKGKYYIALHVEGTL